MSLNSPTKIIVGRINVNAAVQKIRYRNQRDKVAVSTSTSIILLLHMKWKQRYATD